MTLVTAAIVEDGPIRCDHSEAARSIGSKGRGAAVAIRLPNLAEPGLGALATWHSGPVIVAFSVAPSGPARPGMGPDASAAGEPTDSVSEAVAEAVRIVRDSGLPHETSSMFTSIEGEWDEVMDVVRRATEAVGRYGTRVSLVLKADIRPGWTGQMEAKVTRLEEHLRG